MQLGPVSSPYYRLPQRPEVLDDAVSPSRTSNQKGSQQQTEQLTSAPQISEQSESSRAQREYYYARVEPVVGRTAEALKNYTEVEDGTGREELKEQFGLDLYV